MATNPKKINRPWLKDKKPFERPNDMSSFYNSRKWRKTSKTYREAHPTCECVECKKLELIKPAQVCDHIKGLKYYLENNLDPYAWENLQSMSNECHNKKSGQSAGRLYGDRGKISRSK